MKKRRVRTRKPRHFSGAIGAMFYVPESNMDGAMIVADNFMIGADSNECRKLAAWLLKAADWLDAKKEGKK